MPLPRGGTRLAPRRFAGRASAGVYGTRLSVPNISNVNPAQSATTRAYLRGAGDLVRALRRLQDGMSDEAMARATLAAADVLKEAWQERVPVDEGHYRDSITALASPGKVGATAVVFPGDVPGVPDDQQPRNYAARLEFGSNAFSKASFKRGTGGQHRFRTAKPSLRPAYDSCVGRMVDAIDEELRHVIEANT